jgi:hypothetical protein
MAENLRGLPDLFIQENLKKILLTLIRLLKHLEYNIKK